MRFLLIGKGKANGNVLQLRTELGMVFLSPPYANIDYAMSFVICEGKPGHLLC